MTLGLDISTSVIGVALFNKDYKLEALSCLKFKTGAKKKTLFGKLDDFIEFMEEKKYINLPINHIAIEEPLKKFKGKFSNADTIQKLQIMNTLVSGYLYKKLNIEPEYYNVSTARKIVFPNLIIPQDSPNKKYSIWNAVMNAEPHLNWGYSSKTHKLKDENFDMSDAYVVGMAEIMTRIKSKR